MDFFETVVDELQLLGELLWRGVLPQLNRLQQLVGKEVAQVGCRLPLNRRVAY